MAKSKAASETKVSPPTTAEGAEYEEKKAKYLKAIGQNAGRSGGLSHVVLATRLLSCFAPEGKLIQQDLYEGLKESSDAVVGGNMETIERMLNAQMMTLNAIFAANVNNSLNAEWVDHLEMFMRLALKAQAQCARTAEVLGNLRSGPAIFAKQANIAHGHQQVNNAASSTGKAPRARETEKPKNELLEAKDGERLDHGTTAEAIRTDKEMAAVEEIHRPEDRKRQGKSGGQ